MKKDIGRRKKKSEKSMKVYQKAVGIVNCWEYAVDQKNRGGNVITVA